MFSRLFNYTSNLTCVNVTLVIKGSNSHGVRRKRTACKQDDLARDMARADFCRFLAACYYQSGPEFAEEKLFDSMQASASRIHPDFAAGARRLGEAFAAEDPEALLIDYTRLFLGPVDTLAKPYGSIWLRRDNTLMEESTVAVQ